MINNVSLSGRLTRDIELKYTGSGIAVASFTLAVERKFTNAQGERDTDFINCVAWRKTAETMANYLNKGSLIGVEGHIQTRNYKHNDGYTVYITEVLVDNFSFLESKAQSQQNNQSNQNAQQNDNPFTNTGVDDNPFVNSAKENNDDPYPF